MTSDVSLYASYESWKGWDRLFTYTQDKADYFQGETAGLAIKNADVLEIGFGSGDLLQWMIDQGARVVGSEINPVLMQAAIDRGVATIAPQIDSLQEAGAGVFDTIVSFDVFEHFTFDQVEAYLVAAEHMLKSGGHLLLRFPNSQSPFGLAPQNGDPTHVSALSRSVLESFLVRRNLAVVRYGHEYRARGRTIRQVIGRRFRGICRDLITVVLNAIFSTDIPYDPVVVIVLRKI